MPNLPYIVSQAWAKADLVLAIFSYFSWNEPPRTSEGLMEALKTLAVISGRQLDSGFLLSWPSTTYRCLGLGDNGVVQQEEYRMEEEAIRLSKSGDVAALTTLLDRHPGAVHAVDNDLKVGDQGGSG